jgi:23S rRNA pseudouridine2605 synthase
MANETDETPDLQPEPSSPELEIASEIETEAAVEAEATAEIETAAAEEPEIEDDPNEAEPEGEAQDKTEAEAHAEGSPETDSDESSEAESDEGSESHAKPRPPAKLERLQKILAAAGVSSRRRAEELIEQGRVQVNGKIVTELGTKADGGRDHIRVDGKLLQGAERLRYFVLNKPKGFVTTAKDPEGRPTVMQFFDKMKERLYPVGRLDYMSEGLLVVTNDGELANKLTKAASGVEKTYLVKVAGQPTEAELDILRGGVAIERGKPGSTKVRTSPARVRQVRQGDNPWYEVVLIEGRNRELRKMFEEVGHFVEKIRRVGYGPLVLDQEPGNLRELDPDELELLRKAAEGKLRTPKAKETRRRNALDAQLPTLRPKASPRRAPVPPMEARPEPGPAQMRPAGPTRTGPARSGPSRTSPARTNPARFGDSRPGKSFGAERPSRGAGSFAKSDDKLTRPARPVSRPAGRPSDPAFERPGTRPAWKKDDRPTRPPSRFGAGSTGTGRPAPERTAPGRPASGTPASERPVPERPAYDRSRAGSMRQDAAGTGRTGAGRSFTAKPSWKKSGGADRTERPAFKRPAAPRRDAPTFDDDLGPVRPPNLQIEEIQAEQSNRTAPRGPRSGSARSGSARPSSARPSTPRPSSDRPRPSRPSFERPTSSARPGAAKPYRSEGGLARPFTTSSGKPRPGGARPSSKPGKPGKPGAGRSYGAASRGPASRGASSSGPRSGSAPAPRSFRRDTGEGSFAPRPSRPAAGSGARPSRPYTPRTEGASDFRPTNAKPYPNSASRAERKAGPGWKPKPSFGGPRKPASGARSKPRPGGFSKSGSKAKPGGSGAGRSGPRPGGKRPGGKKRD